MSLKKSFLFSSKGAFRPPPLNFPLFSLFLISVFLFSIPINVLSENVFYEAVGETRCYTNEDRKTADFSLSTSGLALKKEHNFKIKDYVDIEMVNPEAIRDLIASQSSLVSAVDIISDVVISLIQDTRTLSSSLNSLASTVVSAEDYSFETYQFLHSLGFAQASVSSEDIFYAIAPSGYYHWGRSCPELLGEVDNGVYNEPNAFDGFGQRVYRVHRKSECFPHSMFNDQATCKVKYEVLSPVRQSGCVWLAGGIFTDPPTSNRLSLESPYFDWGGTFIQQFTDKWNDYVTPKYPTDSRFPFEAIIQDVSNVPGPYDWKVIGHYLNDASFIASYSDAKFFSVTLSQKKHYLRAFPGRSCGLVSWDAEDSTQNNFKCNGVKGDSASGNFIDLNTPDFKEFAIPKGPSVLPTPVDPRNVKIEKFANHLQLSLSLFEGEDSCRIWRRATGLEIYQNNSLFIIETAPNIILTSGDKQRYLPDNLDPQRVTPFESACDATNFPILNCPIISAIKATFDKCNAQCNETGCVFNEKIKACDKRCVDLPKGSFVPSHTTVKIGDITCKTATSSYVADEAFHFNDTRISDIESVINDISQNTREINSDLDKASSNIEKAKQDLDKAKDDLKNIKITVDERFQVHETKINSLFEAFSNIGEALESTGIFVWDGAKTLVVSAVSLASKVVEGLFGSSGVLVDFLTFVMKYGSIILFLILLLYVIYKFKFLCEPASRRPIQGVRSPSGTFIEEDKTGKNKNQNCSRFCHRWCRGPKWSTSYSLDQDRKAVWSAIIWKLNLPLSISKPRVKMMLDQQTAHYIVRSFSSEEYRKFFKGENPPSVSYEQAVQLADKAGANDVDDFAFVCFKIAFLFNLSGDVEKNLLSVPFLIRRFRSAEYPPKPFHIEGEYSTLDDIRVFLSKQADNLKDGVHEIFLNGEKLLNVVVSKGKYEIGILSDGLLMTIDEFKNKFSKKQNSKNTDVDVEKSKSKPEVKFVQAPKSTLSNFWCFFKRSESRAPHAQSQVQHSDVEMSAVKFDNKNLKSASTDKQGQGKKIVKSMYGVSQEFPATAISLSPKTAEKSSRHEYESESDDDDQKKIKRTVSDSDTYEISVPNLQRIQKELEEEKKKKGKSENNVAGIESLEEKKQTIKKKDEEVVGSLDVSSNHLVIENILVRMFSHEKLYVTESITPDQSIDFKTLKHYLSFKDSYDHEIWAAPLIKQMWQKLVESEERNERLYLVHPKDILDILDPKFTDKFRFVLKMEYGLTNQMFA